MGKVSSVVLSVPTGGYEFIWATYVGDAEPNYLNIYLPSTIHAQDQSN